MDFDKEFKKRVFYRNIFKNIKQYFETCCLALPYNVTGGPRIFQRCEMYFFVTKEDSGEEDSEEEDSGEEGFRRRDSGEEGFRRGGIQERRDSVDKGFRRGGMQGRRDTRQKGCRRGGKQDRREAGMQNSWVGDEVGIQIRIISIFQGSK